MEKLGCTRWKCWNTASNLASRLGYQIRQEYLSGNGGGGCVLKGKKIFFLDLALDPAEQLDLVIDTLAHDRRRPEFAHAASNCANCFRCGKVHRGSK